MSDGKEVKRWETISIDTKIPGTGPDVDGVPRVTVVSASDHDRIVAELKAEVDELKYELSSRTEGLRQTRQDWLDSQKTIARQAKVIEKLKKAKEKPFFSKEETDRWAEEALDDATEDDY